MPKEISIPVAVTAGRFAGEVALVTGGGTKSGFRFPRVGTGAASALLLAAEGASVAIVDKDRGSLERTGVFASQLGVELLLIEADVSQEKECESAVATVLQEL